MKPGLQALVLATSEWVKHTLGDWRAKNKYVVVMSEFVLTIMYYQQTQMPRAYSNSGHLFKTVYIDSL